MSCYRETFTFTLTLFTSYNTNIFSRKRVLLYGTARTQIIVNSYQLYVLVNGEQEHRESTR
jgi:hypothetical protein